MNFPAVLLLSCSPLFAAQAPITSIKPHIEADAAASNSASLNKRTTSVAAPVLGYVLGSGPTDLHVLLATAAAPKLGPALPAPADARRLYLPPREMYALVDVNSGSALSVWQLHKEFTSGVQQAPVSIAGAISHPDLVGFSPLGSAAILYSQSEGVIQAVTHLPMQPVVTQLSMTNLVAPTKLSISDDGELAVAQLVDGTLLSTYKGGAWNALPVSLTSAAWAFVARTQNLVLSESGNKTVILLPHVDGAWTDAKVLTQAVDADQLASTRDGSQIVAAKQGVASVWSIDLADGTVSEHAVPQDTRALIALRDGFSFLLSETPAIGVLKLAAAAAPAAAPADQSTRSRR